VKVENEDSLPRSVKRLIFSNRLIVKAIESDTLKKLHFIILNETKHVLSYDRAFLWDLVEGKPNLSGVSGFVDFDQDTEMMSAWERIVNDIRSRNAPCELTREMFPDHQKEWKVVTGTEQARYYWLPIYTQEKLLNGLVITYLGKKEKDAQDSEEIDIFMNFLMPGYAAALDKFTKKQVKIGKQKRRLAVLGAAFALFLAGNFFEVPLRIVSTCEVVSKSPVIIAAPLEGVIKEIEVLPGQEVKQGDLLVTFEDSYLLQDLELAKKEVELRDAEINRIQTQGYDDEDKLAEYKVFLAKSDQAHAKLNFVQHQYDLSTIESPADGLVSIDSPEEWKGRPVAIGEKIMTLDQQEDTKVLIWVAEGDNINLESQYPIKIVLNASPNTSYEATLDYVSTISQINNENIVSFEAEASWVTPPEDVRIGQKGVAIMYGEKVSFIYYLFRKPILFIRRTLGF